MGTDRVWRVTWDSLASGCRRSGWRLDETSWFFFFLDFQVDWNGHKIVLKGFKCETDELKSFKVSNRQTPGLPSVLRQFIRLVPACGPLLMLLSWVLAHHQSEEPTEFLLPHLSAVTSSINKGSNDAHPRRCCLHHDSFPICLHLYQPFPESPSLSQSFGGCWVWPSSQFLLSSDFERHFFLSLSPDPCQYCKGIFPLYKRSWLSFILVSFQDLCYHSDTMMALITYWMFLDF